MKRDSDLSFETESSEESDFGLKFQQHNLQRSACKGQTYAEFTHNPPNGESQFGREVCILEEKKICGRSILPPIPRSPTHIPKKTCLSLRRHTAQVRHYDGHLSQVIHFEWRTVPRLKLLNVCSPIDYHSKLITRLRRMI